MVTIMKNARKAEDNGNRQCDFAKLGSFHFISSSSFTGYRESQRWYFMFRIALKITGKDLRTLYVVISATFCPKRLIFDRHRGGSKFSPKMEASSLLFSIRSLAST